MRKSSIVLEHHKDVSVGYFFHNSREKKTQNSIFSLDNNFTNRNGRDTIKVFWNELNKRIKKYTERTGRKLHKNTIKHISGIFNINENTTKKQIEKVIKYLEDSLDTKVIQYSIHKDEGHTDEQGNKKVNYHVHLEMLGIDSEGRSVRKKIDRKYLINLQTKVSELLEMERGVSKKITKRKRLNTYEYKEHLKLQEQEMKLLKEENEKLKTENKELKEELKLTKEQSKKSVKTLKDIRNYIKTINQGLELFTREDYSQISKIQKELRKYNYTTLNELKSNINKLIEYFEKKLTIEKLNNKQKDEIINEIKRRFRNDYSYSMN